MTSFVFACAKCKDGSIDAVGLKSYIDCYREHFPVSEYDIKAMPYILYFWQCICNYSPEEKIPANYKPIIVMLMIYHAR